jgi:molybdate transport system regulatory protein
MPPTVTIEPRFRVRAGRRLEFGPGKAALLEGIAQTGSIGEAARGMGMAYMTAWNHVRSLNRAPGGPFVTATRGGARRGGATLTPAGEELLRLYRKLEASSLAASAPAGKKLTRLLRP